MRLKVFIGSSQHDLKYAKAIAKILQKANVAVLGWWDHKVFPIGKPLIHSLDIALAKANAAILVAGPGDAVRTRAGERVWQARDNVIFEYGLFYAARGSERVGLAAFKKVQLPSDIGGVLHMKLRERKPFSERKFIADNTAEIHKWLDPLMSRASEAASIEVCWTAVGDFERLFLDYLVPAIATATEIDMISIYRPVAEMDSRLHTFRTIAGNRLRLCFSNVWDPVLNDVYRRKVTKKPPGYFEGALTETIRRFLGDKTQVDAANPKRIRVSGSDRYPAGYRVYLTPQRITYNYCRVGDVMMIIPLDMKTEKQPSPLGWVIRSDDAPDAFSYYVHEFERVIHKKQSQCIYGRRKTGPEVV